MIEVTENPISPEIVIGKVRNNRSGCVVTYVGFIRDYSQDKPVLSVEYMDLSKTAANTLRNIADEVRQRWRVENIAIFHRIGKLKVGEINLVVAIASVHRNEGFAACQYVIDQFKQKLPTRKIDTYQDDSGIRN